MEDAETFENVLSIILGQDISIKGHPQSEHEKRTSPLKRQVRLMYGLRTIRMLYTI